MGNQQKYCKYNSKPSTLTQTQWKTRPQTPLIIQSQSGKMSCRLISWSLETARFGVKWLYQNEIWHAPRQECEAPVTFPSGQTTLHWNEKGRQEDSPDIHWRRWRQASTSPVNIKAVNLTTFLFLNHISRVSCQKDPYLPCLYRGYPAKRALPAMLTHGG